MRGGDEVPSCSLRVPVSGVCLVPWMPAPRAALLRRCACDAVLREDQPVFIFEQPVCARALHAFCARALSRRFQPSPQAHDKTSPDAAPLCLPQVKGDAFLARVMDNGDDFDRLDLDLSEVSSSAAWVQQAQQQNERKRQQVGGCRGGSRGGGRQQGGWVAGQRQQGGWVGGWQGSSSGGA